MRNNNMAGHMAAGVTALIWGTTFISTKLLLEYLTPVDILAIRFVIGYLALWLVCPRWLKVQDRIFELLCLGAGISGVSLYFMMENVALTLTYASNVGVIVAVAPFFTALISRYSSSQGERAGLSFFMGFLLALGGIALISFTGSDAFGLNPLGDILALGAAILWAVYSNLMKRIASYGHDTFIVTRRVIFYGLVTLLPFLLVLGEPLDTTVLRQPQVLVHILFLGVGASAVCFVTWNFAVGLLGAVRTSVYIYLVPVVTVFMSVIFLHEQTSSLSIIGTALTLAGLVVSQGKPGWKMFPLGRV